MKSDWIFSILIEESSKDTETAFQSTTKNVVLSNGVITPFKKIKPPGNLFTTVA